MMFLVCFWVCCYFVASLLERGFAAIGSQGINLKEGRKKAYLSWYKLLLILSSRIIPSLCIYLVSLDWLLRENMAWLVPWGTGGISFVSGFRKNNGIWAGRMVSLSCAGAETGNYMPFEIYPMWLLTTDHPNIIFFRNKVFIFIYLF